MERLAALHPGGTITADDLPETFVSGPSSFGEILLQITPEGVDLEKVERGLIREALERNDWNQTRAARFLRISRNTLIYRMQKYGITPPSHGHSTSSAAVTT
ncbi:MAG: helix-turn-helix domain-containing protein, partial [Acidobacteriota bacterium]